MKVFQALWTRTAEARIRHRRGRMLRRFRQWDRPSPTVCYGAISNCCGWSPARQLVSGRTVEERRGDRLRARGVGEDDMGDVGDGDGGGAAERAGDVGPVAS